MDGISQPPEELVEKMRRYWEKWERVRTDEDGAQALAYYRQELLPAELAYARARGAVPTTPQEQTEYRVLVLLAGFSFEPLLQSVCVYEPAEVLVIASQWYERINREGKVDDPKRGEDLATELHDQIRQLEPPALPHRKTPILRQPPACVESTPVEVFRALRKRLQEDLRQGHSVIIDITGAKKSMASGAYLFGAVTEGNIQLSYVDFDLYDSTTHRPAGYSCRIEPLKNPYHGFRLRDWERVRHLYERRAYGAARELLEKEEPALVLDAETGLEKQEKQTLLQAMEGWYDDAEVRAARCLLEALRLYEHWDNTDYVAARRVWDDLRKSVPGLPVPRAVRALGHPDLDWPQVDVNIPAHQAAQTLIAKHRKLLKEGRFYLLPSQLSVYARDEIERIRRLIDYKKDYRAALLRSAALFEILLKARVALLWHLGDGLQFEPPRDSPVRLSSRIYPDDLGFLSEEFPLWSLYLALVWQKPGDDIPEVKIKMKGRHLSVQVHRSERAPQLPSNWKVPGLTVKDLRDLRNGAIHNLLSVTCEVADAALGLARENLDEYSKEWATLVDKDFSADVIRDLEDFQAPAWDRLWRECMLSTARRLIQSEKEPL